MLTFAIAVALALFGQPQAQTGQYQQEQEMRNIPQRQFQLKTLQVEELKVGEKLEHKLKAWVMDTELKRQEGLMFVLDTDMTKDQAMIFVFKNAETLSFWMKNTYIPLDLLFVRADGTIARIAANAVPHSLDPIEVGEPVAAVLEIAGGRAAALGIAEGDRVSWPGGPAR